MVNKHYSNTQRATNTTGTAGKTERTEKSVGQERVTRRPPGTGSRSFYGTGAFKWAVYPDYWKASWGEKPLLGHVYADSEFYAIREAYNRGLLTQNYTIEPAVVNIGVAVQRY
jgi:hypothetical protein